MTYITREDGITALPLSNRAANCLRREGLHSIGDKQAAATDYSAAADGGNVLPKGKG